MYICIMYYYSNLARRCTVEDKKVFAACITIILSSVMLCIFDLYVLVVIYDDVSSTIIINKGGVMFILYKEFVL